MFRLLPISKASNNAAWGTPSPKGSTGSLVTLLGLMICYQVINQIILGSKLHDDIDEEGECGFVEGHARPPWCAEAQLFRSWQAASTAEVFFDLQQVLRSEGAEEYQLLLAKGDVEVAPLPAPLEASTQQSTVGPAEVPSTSAPAQDKNSKEAFSTGVPAAQRAAPASNLSSLRHRFEALEQAVVAKQEEKEVQHEEKDSEVHAASGKEVTLREQIATARCEMCKVPHRQNYSECAEFLNISSCSSLGSPQWQDFLTRWMKDLVALQTGFESRQAARKSSAWRTSSSSTQHKEASVVEQIVSLGCEMCLEPHRRDYPQCAPFRSTLSCAKAQRVSNASNGVETLDAGLANISAEHKAWDAKVAARVADFRKQLCADPQRRGSSACAEVSSHAADAQTRSIAVSQLSVAPPSPSLRGTASRSQEALVVHRHDLDHVWFPSLHGKIPKVACITVIPQGWGALSQLPHLVKGFRNQTYEGSKMLVLVYHFQNQEAAGVVQSYADGTRILAVAARGDTGDFPSAATFRFGAWRAEKEGAEVVARWDLDAWHGPKRLAMQVRALTHSSRPACVLGRSWRWHGARSGKGSAGRLDGDGMVWGERTLVGTADWMRRHWYPLVEEETPLEEGPNKGDLAVLDMPELFIFVSVDAVAGSH